MSVMIKKAGVFLSLLFIICALSDSAKAQSRRYMEGDIIANLGYSFGQYLDIVRMPGIRRNWVAPITFNAEYGFHSLVSAGIIARYSQWEYATKTYAYQWNFINAGIRSSFHIGRLLNENLDMEFDTRVMDLYWSVQGGIHRRNYKGLTETAPAQDYKDGFFYGTALGWKFMPHHMVGGFVEPGLSIYNLRERTHANVYFQIGVTGRL